MAFSLSAAETSDQASSGVKAFELTAKLRGQLIYDVQLTQDFDGRADALLLGRAGRLFHKALQALPEQQQKDAMQLTGGKYVFEVRVGGW
jgi:hypothetical protein